MDSQARRDLIFTTNIKEALDDSNIIFIAVGTPMNDDTAATSMTLQSERKDLNCIKSVVKLLKNISMIN